MEGKSVARTSHRSQVSDRSDCNMSDKKPVVIVESRARGNCPVCGKPAYSAAATHPQCAAARADAPSRANLKKTAAKSSAAPNTKCGPRPVPSASGSIRPGASFAIAATSLGSPVPSARGARFRRLLNGIDLPELGGWQRGDRAQQRDRRPSNPRRLHLKPPPEERPRSRSFSRKLRSCTPRPHPRSGRRGGPAVTLCHRPGVRSRSPAEARALSRGAGLGHAEAGANPVQRLSGGSRNAGRHRASSRCWTGLADCWSTCTRIPAITRRTTRWC